MKFIHRLGYYLGGFAIGLVILAFFLSGKRASCAYFPEARVLKNLGTKPYTLSAKAQTAYTTLRLDSLDIKNIWKEGEVNFGESQTRKEPCGVYSVYGNTLKNKTIHLTVANCDSITHIQSIEKK